MNYGSVCSGIEAATVAWHEMGWKPSFFSEIEKFPRDVLTHHYATTPLHGDFTTIQKDVYEPIDLLVGGTPCQSFSVAGLREGLNDPRGNLMLEFGALANRLHPTWLVWENVPGVLSSNGGRDFASFLGMLGQLGYGFAYRVLDAQYFGVPQRRRRVFVVGCFGDWRSAAAVLFERHSLQGHSAPSRGERKEVTEIAGTLTSNGGGLNRPAGNANELDFCVTTFDRLAQSEYGTSPIASTVLSRDYKGPSDLVSYGIPGNWINRKPENGGNAVEPMHNLSPCLTKTDQHAVAFHHQASSTQSMNPSEVCPTLDKSKSPALMQGLQVRRLTPVECERLQGFPDNYTNIPGASDSHRYKALGNSMAVPVMRWIGNRIQMIKEMQ
jgi:DNA (cytosine-5)-methyltransferase 1